MEENSTNDWWAMMRPGKRARVGTRIEIRNLRGKNSGKHAVVTGLTPKGTGELYSREPPTSSANCRRWEKFPCLRI